MANGHGRDLRVNGQPQHRCLGCGKRPPEVAFHKRKRSGTEYWFSRCKLCTNSRKRERENAVDEYGNKAARRYSIKKRYGMTAEEWDALWNQQGNACAICRTVESDGKYWHTDHDHFTGEVRGILCHGCNTGLGNFGDDPVRLKMAIEYLEARNG